MVPLTIGGRVVRRKFVPHGGLRGWSSFVGDDPRNYDCLGGLDGGKYTKSKKLFIEYQLRAWGGGSWTIKAVTGTGRKIMGAPLS